MMRNGQRQTLNLPPSTFAKINDGSVRTALRPNIDARAGVNAQGAGGGKPPSINATAPGINAAAPGDNVTAPGVNVTTPRANIGTQACASDTVGSRHSRLAAGRHERLCERLGQHRRNYAGGSANVGTSTSGGATSGTGTNASGLPAHAEVIASRLNQPQPSTRPPVQPHRRVFVNRP